MRHLEGHRTERIGWLRAAVLGANDGIVSTEKFVYLRLVKESYTWSLAGPTAQQDQAG